MAATVSVPLPLSPTRAGGVDQEDSNVSSPLSEVDDKDDNEENIKHMHLDSDRDVTPRPKKQGSRASDSDSILSDAHSDMHSDDANDTEAETERLYDTPRHERRRDVVVDQFNEGQVFEHSPSKLRRMAKLEEETEHGDEESLSGDDATSIISTRAGDESPLKNQTTQITATDEDIRRDSQERKRKRSSVADPPDLDQPLRKRTSSGPEQETSVEKHNEDGPPNEDETEVANESSGSPSPTEQTQASPRKKAIAHDDELTERETRATKKSTRGSKRKAAVAADADIDTDTTSHHSTGRRDAEHNDEADADADEEVDSTHAHDEELERKHSAFRDWTQIEEMFGIFRDRLYKDRLQRLEEEEQSLLASEPTHPEYLNMKQCLDDRLQQKLDGFNRELEYRIKAHERRAVAQRAQIWGQYFQGVREKREKTLEALNHEWYDVQTARRSAHSLENYGLLFPKDPAQRLRNAMAYNSEVSALASIAKYEGFPAGPEMKGASPSELDHDLAIIEQSRRMRQKPTAPPREEYQPTSFARLGAAGEQFLKDTPWANPNHVSHKSQPQQQPDQTPSRGALASTAAFPDAKVGLETPASKPKSSPAQNRLSESPELSRSMFNSMHQPMKRVSLPNVSRGSKAAAA